MQLELISFTICPYVQRSVITLNYKNCDYKITFIDLSCPPPWFLQLSPLGKVPLLKVNDKEILFESAVINEFIDDVTPSSLRPTDPLLLAKNRAWIEYGSTCLTDLYLMGEKKTKKELNEQVTAATQRLQRLEQQINPQPYFNEDQFSLVDAAYAPLLLRIDILNQRTNFLDGLELVKLNAWKQNLIKLTAVKKSMVDGFEQLYIQKVKNQQGYLGSLL